MTNNNGEVDDTRAEEHNRGVNGTSAAEHSSWAANAVRAVEFREAVECRGSQSKEVEKLTRATGKWMIRGRRSMVNGTSATEHNSRAANGVRAVDFRGAVECRGS